MATLHQIEANRRNAARSTGPRSVEGKAASRFNALKHGIDAESLVIPGEDSETLDALSRDYREQFQPVGPLESFLVDTLIQAEWNRRRYARAEAELLRAVMVHPEIPQECALGAVFSRDDDRTLQRLFRRIHSAEQNYFRALKELRRAQEERRAQAQTDPPDPGPAEARKPAAPAQPPTDENWLRSAPAASKLPAQPAASGARPAIVPLKP